ncbi:MAG: tetratricopeptide repeat protein [Peptoniphilus sp.]|nr:tetratricopeptide repeat protein [Peptoniphilus sp.]MDD7362521.1 tetratricopeptide repeat protein [Bacillota bacterium]MDY6045080.1 tetratricopeptide repeat protein [Peptoniphilus sp.]
MDSKKYLADWYDEIGFLEQREDGSQILNGVPIPMLQSDIIEEIKHPDKDDRLDVGSIFTAMCIVVGLDEKFPYAQNYLTFLKRTEDDTVGAIQYRMVEAAERGEVERLYLLAKAKEAVRGNIDDRLETTYAMEGIYNRRWKEDRGESSDDLLKEIMDRYEKIIEDDPENADAHMSLGRIYQARAFYIKAKFYYEKALQLTSDPDLKDALRECIDDVHEPAAIDAARTYLHYGRYEDALKSIGEVESQYADPGASNHIKGMAYYGMGAYDRAVEYLREAVRHSREADVLNDYAIALAANENEKEAIETLAEVIEMEPENRTALMNRGILYYREKNYPAALVDFERAYRLVASDELWELIEQTRKRSEDM